MLDLKIIEGVDLSTSGNGVGDAGVEEEQDSIEARLVMKLNCKHGEFPSLSQAYIQA